MSSDTTEIRLELDAAWRAVRDRLVGSGYARAAVVETMMGVALADLDELYGLQEATQFILKARSFRRRISEPRPVPRPAEPVDIQPFPAPPRVTRDIPAPAGTPTRRQRPKPKNGSPTIAT